jgi:translation initiation factor IF-1
MQPVSSTAVPITQSGTSIRKILKSYFYWTYPRGSFHYDVMVTLILLFIFVTPFFWSYGDKPTVIARPFHPIQVIANDGHGLIVTVEAEDAEVPAGASNAVVKKALRKAIEPVTGDAVFVEHWETVTDAQGNVTWKIWAHR